MLKKLFKFIHDLKVFFLAIIFFSFLSMLGANPIDMIEFFSANLGKAVGVSTTVPENPFNSLAAQLKEKENKLALKENELKQREDSLSGINSAQNRSILFIGIGVVVLFVLILINFIMDYKRKK